MLNVYYTIEPSYKVKAFLQNQSNFYILDVQKVIRDLGFSYPLRTNGERFLVNRHITGLIRSKLNYKKLYGIIYINRTLNSDVVRNIRSTFDDCENMGSHILLDNALMPKLNSIYAVFDEVVFYENFKKLKIFDITETCDLFGDVSTYNLEKSKALD